MKKPLLIAVLLPAVMTLAAVAEFNTAALFKLDAALRPLVKPYGHQVGVCFVDLSSQRELQINAQLVKRLAGDPSKEAEGVVKLVDIIETPAGNYFLSVFTQDISQESEAKDLIRQISQAALKVYTYQPAAPNTEAQKR